MNRPRNWMPVRRIPGRACWALGVGLWCAVTGVAVGQTLDEARQLVADGKPNEAAVAFRHLAEQTDDPVEEVKARNNACVLFNNLGDAPAALPQCERALELRRLADDDRGLARTLNNLALTQQSLGRFEAAGKSFEEALQVNQRRGDVAAEALVRSNLGWLWTSAGRYAEATRQLDAALALATEHAEETWAAEQQAFARLNYGVVLEKLGAYREALDLYTELLADETLGPSRRAAVELNRGVMYRNLEDPVEALAAFERAAERFAEQRDGASLANAWLNIGLARHLNLGQLEAAEEALVRALDEALQSGDRGEELQIRLQQGRLRLAQGELEAAEAAFEGSLALAESVGSAEGRWEALDGRGRLHETRGDLDAARADFEASLAIIEGVRADLDRGDWRAGYLGGRRAVYAALIRVLTTLSTDRPGGTEAKEAWEWVQRAKARELLEAVGGTERPLTAESLGPLLGDDALLELFIGESNLYAWVADSVSGLRFVDLGPAAPVIERVAALHSGLARGEALDEAMVASLSARLLASTDPLGRSPRRLWITADGLLRRLPFEVLEIGGQPLVEHVAVSYLPNTSALAGVRQRSTGSAEDEVLLAGLGDPQLPGSPPRSSGLATPAELLTRRFALDPLPGTRQELEAIAEALGGPVDLRLGESATESAFRQLAASPGSVLHVATHALLDDRPGGGAAIVLSPEGGDDGVLWASDVAKLSVRRRLTVLSACRSALAPEEGGDALTSLSGALLAAGSSAVVASLWDVDDAATAVFMEQLYHQLGQGLEPAEALRQAKRRLRADARWNRPAVWAAFVLVGDGDAVVPPRPQLLRWLAAAALVTAVLLLAGRRRAQA